MRITGTQKETKMIKRKKNELMRETEREREKE